MARSTTVTIYNMTGFYFIKETATVVGHWEGEPTDINPYINKGLTGNNKMIAKSVDTHANDGTGGTITYKLNNFKNAVYIHWDNPFWGNNSYSINVSDDMQKQYNIQVYHSEGKGNDASIDIVLYQKYTNELCMSAVVVTPHPLITDFTFEGAKILFKVDGRSSTATSLVIQAHIKYDANKFIQVMDKEVPTVKGESSWIGAPNLGPNVIYDIEVIGASSENSKCEIHTIYKELTISPDKIGPFTKNISGGITASGCDGKMIFKAHGLPTGMIISPEGKLSGAVSERVEQNIQVEVSNGNGNHGVKDYLLKIN